MCQPNLHTILVPARGLEPRTLGLKARSDLRRTPPQASCRTRFSASRLPVAPGGTPPWQYKLAMRQRPDRDVMTRRAEAQMTRTGIWSCPADRALTPSQPDQGGWEAC